VYFAGALVFFAGGSFVMYYGHPIIGMLLWVPGLILVGLTLIAWVMFSRITSAARDAAHMDRDPEGTQHVSQPQRTHGFTQKRLRRHQKKRP
jgi:hypothetical protein